MSKTRFYGIRKGRRPGVYDSWPEAKAQVDRYSGAIYQGFNTYEEAHAWVYGSPRLVEVEINGLPMRLSMDALRDLLADLAPAGP